MSIPLVPVAPLVLAGGKSRRMGCPKHLLQFPDGTPLYRHQLNLVRQACPDSATIYISLAQDTPLDEYLQGRPVITAGESPDIASNSSAVIIRDLEANNNFDSAGPAQGLLSAYRYDPTATWLVVAVDYPLLTAGMLQRLRQAYQPPVMCFRNSEKYSEPLLSIWSPEALGKLAENVKNGVSSGPCRVVRELGGTQIDMTLEEVESGRLTNANIKQEWEDVLMNILGSAKAS